MSEKVLAILTHYKRPTNIPQVLASLKEQTRPPDRLVVVDNSTASPYGMETYPNSIFNGASDVWRFTENLGCPCHFAPALCLYGYDYVLFVDDDLILGKQAIENLLEVAQDLNGEFSTIGQMGRQFNLSEPSGSRYTPRNCNRHEEHPNRCDLTCRAHLVRSDVMHHVVHFRNDLLARFQDFRKELVERLVGIHDDMLMCLSIQRGTGWPSYVIPRRDNERELIVRNLDESGAIWKRPNHFDERNQFIDAALNCGWRSLVPETVKEADPWLQTR